jgi:hypothetical protein
VDEIPGGFALVPELIVAFHRPSQAQAILEHIGGKLVDELGPGTWSVDLTGNRGAVAAARWLNRRPQIDYAELNLKFQTEAIPNDPFFSTQWSLHQANDVDINLPEAWSITTGSATTLIAVIDSGIDYNHPDLASHIYVNPREVASNGRDDDGNGYIDDTRGWNFVDRNANATDDNGHGTHVAGIVAATTNNAVGMAGVNQQAQILPLKFIDRWGAGSIGDAVAAIRYAVHQGARVLNASWATPTRSRALNEVIAWAGSRGAVFVTAAGSTFEHSQRCRDRAVRSPRSVVEFWRNDRGPRRARGVRAFHDSRRRSRQLVRKLHGRASCCGSRLAYPRPPSGVFGVPARCPREDHGQAPGHSPEQSHHRRHGRCGPRCR